MNQSYAAYKGTPQNKGPTQTESEGLGKKKFQANRQEKRATVAILISDKIYFKKP